MTTQELSNEFDLLYNNISSNQAPGLDEYEKSVFLTQAQEAVVLGIYNGRVSGEGFESSEEVREYIDDLVKEIETSTPTTGVGATSFSVFYSHPNDLWFPVFEQVTFDDPKLSCEPTRKAEVKPITHDTLYPTLRNPFKGPSDRRVLRLSIAGNKMELISKYKIGSYFLRYLIKPDPIVLEDLPTGLSVNGVTTRTECKLDQVIHRLILEKAVQTAKMVWQSNQ